jgi:hypothetical protein
MRDPRGTIRDGMAAATPSFVSTASVPPRRRGSGEAWLLRLLIKKPSNGGAVRTLFFPISLPVTGNIATPELQQTPLF